MATTLISWNVNGLRAVHRKGALDNVFADTPDVVALQEIKAQVEQLPEALRHRPGYTASFHPAERKGYSGTALYSRTSPSLSVGFDGEPDPEGRVQVADFQTFRLYNIYYPNGCRNEARLSYKMAFYERFLRAVTHDVSSGLNVVVCGDVNTAHRPIDLARPTENETRSGFLPQERAYLDRLLNVGFIDTFRHLHADEGERYTWWDPITRARLRNVGWRIDYFFVSASLASAIVSADILDTIEGSDHCPIRLTLAV